MEIVVSLRVRVTDGSAGHADVRQRAVVSFKLHTIKADRILEITVRIKLQSDTVFLARQRNRVLSTIQRHSEGARILCTVRFSGTIRIGDIASVKTRIIRHQIVYDGTFRRLSLEAGLHGRRYRHAVAYGISISVRYCDIEGIAVVRFSGRIFLGARIDELATRPHGKSFADLGISRSKVPLACAILRSGERRTVHFHRQRRTFGVRSYAQTGEVQAYRGLSIHNLGRLGDHIGQHRPVVMHRHRQQSGRRIAGGIRHRNVDFVGKRVIFADALTRVSLLSGQAITVLNLPRAVLLRGSRHLHDDAVHRQCFVGGKPILVERLAVDQAQGNGRVLPSAVVQRNGAVFAVQIHGKGTSARGLMAGIVRIHHIAVGQQRLIHDNGVGTRVGRGKVQFFRVGIAIGVRGRHRNVGVGAVFLDFENEVAVLTGNDDVAVRPGFSLRKLAQIGAAGSAVVDFYPLYDCSIDIMRVHGKRRICSGIVVRAEGNGNRVDIFISFILGFHRRDHRSVVSNDHGHHADIRAAIHVRHGHGKVMGKLLVRGVCIVLQGVAGQLVGKLQLARSLVEARHRQRAFIRGYGVSGKRAVFKHGHAINSDVLHAVGRIDGQRTFGRGGRSVLPGLRAVVKAGFIDRQSPRTHLDAVVHAVDGDGHLALGHVAVGVGVGVGKFFRQPLAVGERLHLRIVVIKRVAVAAVGVQRDCAVLALLRRVRPRKVRAVRTGRRAFKRVAFNRSSCAFRHVALEALDGRHVVGDLDTDHGRAAVAVPVRHHHCHFVGDGIVFAASV